jgi:hypothetical protein
MIGAMNLRLMLTSAKAPATPENSGTDGANSTADVINPTKGPWWLSDECEGSHGARYLAVQSETRENLAVIYLPAPDLGDPVGAEEARANAALIVGAANSHQRLADILDSTLAILSSPNPNSSDRKRLATLREELGQISKARTGKSRSR